MIDFTEQQREAAFIRADMQKAYKIIADARARYIKDGKKFHDRVTNMLDKTMAHIGDDYQDILDEADAMARENDQRLCDKQWIGGQA